MPFTDTFTFNTKTDFVVYDVEHCVVFCESAVPKMDP